MKLIILFIVLICTSAQAQPANSCTVDAIAVASKLQKSGVQAKVLNIDLAGWNHTVTVYTFQGKILVYDPLDGTRVISNAPKTLTPIEAAQLTYGKNVIRRAWWLEDTPIRPEPKSFWKNTRLIADEKPFDPRSH